MQYNVTVANGTGMEVRGNLNYAHQSLATDFYGATDPSTLSPSCSFPFSKWADTGNGLLKVRNNDDSDWIVIGTVDADGTPHYNASAINNTPSGTISATDVQSAVNSLNVLPLLLRATAYAVDDVAFYAGLPSAMYLQCTTAGTTDTVNITIPSPVAVGDTITDGTVEWTVKKLGSGSGNGRTVGDIFLHAGNGENPQGALLCDGSAVSRTMYPDLFEKIGTTYGAGDGSTTFNLPNLSDNRFVEGSTTAGTAHTAGLPNIKGGFTGADAAGDSQSMWFGAFAYGTSYNQFQRTVGDGYEVEGSFDASLSNSIYSDSVTTVQPKSLTLRYFIQAFDGQTPDSALIDITQYAQELATKANRQLSNLDTANLACHVVVDSYYDSTTGDWWREYDDGWIEQGGLIGNGGTTDYFTKQVTLLKPMKDTTYSITALSYYGTPGNSYSPAIEAISTTNFTLQKLLSYPVSNGARWSVCGMGASV